MHQTVFASDRYFKKQEIILYRPEDQETMEEIAFASSDW